ncbi:MAG: NAD(P)H-hydrate dehydratase, partial [bacterium]
MRFTTGERMGRIDRISIEDYKVSNDALMESAGQLTARHIRNNFLSTSHQESVLILCGKGHNGADGLVVARWLDKWGYRVSVLLAVQEEECSEMTRQQSVCLHKENSVRIETYSSGDMLPSADLYVDALLGTGLSGEPRSPFDEIIDRLNRKNKPTVCVDIPSGLAGDYHLPYQPCVDGDLTVTMGLPKIGMLLEPGYTKAGTVIVQELGFPETVYEEEAGPCHLISGFEMARFLPKRLQTDHKGSAGRVGIAAGSKKYPGAAFLTANAASRMGAGLASLIGPENISQNQGRGDRDIVFPFTQNEIINNEIKQEKLQEFARRQDAFIIGPGLDRNPRKKELLNNLLPVLDSPVVIDADGLNNFAENPEQLKDCSRAILTPHPGEAARLIDRSLNTVLKKPVESARKICEITGHTTILKTSRPVVAHPDDSYSINVSGSPALAKAGSGDVLTGMIGGLLAQGVNEGPAACLGLYLHGTAGRLIENDKNTITVKSEDLIGHIPEAV